MKILADLHHADLYYSLQLLFEKRLGAELYRPIGLEWWKEGFWHVYNHPATAEQYLGLYQGTTIPKWDDGTELLESERLNANYKIEDGIYYVKDSTKENVVQRAITLDKFKSMEFDILISSMPVHIGPFNKLIELYQPQAKHIFQVGNAWGHLPGIKNILASTAPFSVPSDINTCFYHQEFDLSYFCPPDDINKVDLHSIRSFIQIMRSKSEMNNLMSRLPEWTGRSYGAGMEDHIGKTRDLANIMKHSGFVFHVKPGGDGFGHSLHNAFASGKPVITRSSHYSGKLAGQLMQHGVTCIDLDLCSLDEAADTLRYWTESIDRYQTVSNAVYNRFKQLVNFDQEEQQIRQFLSSLQ